MREEDLRHWFPRSRGSLTFDAAHLVDAYRQACRLQMTGLRAIRGNLQRADHLLTRLGNLTAVTEADIRDWQEARLAAVAPKTVNLELDVLRQLLDLCCRLGWRPDNLARQVQKLLWKLSRLPQALTYAQVQTALAQAWEEVQQAPGMTLAAQRYRLLVAGMCFGLRRGELQALLWRGLCTISRFSGSFVVGFML